jgi:Domain of unknown function (DUF4340)
MNFRSLIVAVVVLATLGGVLYWSQHHKPAEENAVSTNTAPVILKVNPADVTELVVRQKEPVTLVKTDGKWQIIKPKPYPADQVAVAGVLSTLSGLNADRIVEEKTSDRKQYGLEPAQVELDISGKNGATQRLLLGDDTVAGGDVFAALVTDPRVFTVASYSKSSLAKSLNDLRDKSLLTLSADKVSRVELIKKGEDLEFDRTKDGWQILKPSSSPADSAAVNALVSTVTNARMDLSTTTDAAAFARATPVATAKLTGDSGVQTLEVRKNKDDYFAKSSAVDGTYKVDSTVGQALDKKVEDFREKKPAAAPTPSGK